MKKKSTLKKFESKYSVLKKEKLDDLYHINLLRELWSIPHKHIQTYIKQYYPSPTALELVEIRDLLEVIQKAKISFDENGNLKGEGLTEEDQKKIQYKHNRMYGKTRQVIEVSGRDGGPIAYSDLSDDDLEKALHSKIKQIKSAFKKVTK